MATIKGKWVFNETLTWVEIIEHINFSCPSYSEYPLLYGFRMSTATNVLYYWKDANSSGFEAYKKSGGWLNEAYRTVDFGTTEQTVSDTFLTWMQANATPQEDPTPTYAVTIEYNGSVIASLKAGQSATLPCKDTLMHTDVVVSVPDGMGGSVEEWDGSYTVSGGVELIEFAVGLTAYKAEAGMTWGEWVESEYNTGNVGVTTSGDVYLGNATKLISTDGTYSNRIKSTSVIIAGQTYAIYSNSGAD